MSKERRKCKPKVSRIEEIIRTEIDGIKIKNKEN